MITPTLTMNEGMTMMNRKYCSYLDYGRAHFMLKPITKPTGPPTDSTGIGRTRNLCLITDGVIGFCDPKPLDRLLGERELLSR